MSGRFSLNFLSFSLDFLGKLVLIYLRCLRIPLILVDDLLSICIHVINFSFLDDDCFDLLSKR